MRNEVPQLVQRQLPSVVESMKSLFLQHSVYIRWIQRCVITVKHVQQPCDRCHKKNTLCESAVTR